MVSLFHHYQSIKLNRPKPQLSTDYHKTMCTSTKKSLKKRSTTTAKKAVASISFSKPSILASRHMNSAPQSNDLNILVDRVLRQYQQQSSQREQVAASSSSKPLVSTKKPVRFDASAKMAETSSPKEAETSLKTSQVLLQVRIVLKILEKEDPRLRHRLVQSIDRCRKTLPKGRTFNRFVDALMRRMVKSETYQTAAEARMRLAAAV